MIEQRCSSFPIYGSSAPQAYKNALQSGQPTIPFCDACKRYFFYPRPRCPRCLSRMIRFPVFSGRLTVKSAAWVWRPHDQSFEPYIPISLVAAGTEDFTLIAEARGWQPGDRIELGTYVLLAVEKRPDSSIVPVLTRVVGSADQATST